MATARKLPSGSWRVQLYTGKDENGKRQYKSFTSPTKKEAQAAAALFSVQKQKKQESGLTVAESISEYIKNHSNILSPATIRKYESMRKNCYGPIEDKPISELSSMDIQTFINALSVDHKPKTVSCIAGLLTAALKESDPERNFVFKRPSPRKSNITIPTETQVKILIDEAGSPHNECAFLLGAALGLRRSEISAITWDDIDGNILHIRSALVQDKDGNWIAKSTKTDAGTRDLELPDYLKERLLALKPENAKPEDHVIPITPNAITKAFNRAKKRAGISCRFHDLRHYNASVMLALGVPDKYAMQRMGHATPNMLKNVYQHIMDEKEKEVAAMVNQQMKVLVDAPKATRNATRNSESK